METGNIDTVRYTTIEISELLYDACVFNETKTLKAHRLCKIQELHNFITVYE